MNVCPGCGYNFHRVNPTRLENCVNCQERMKRNAKVRLEQEQRVMSQVMDDEWFNPAQPWNEERRQRWTQTPECKNGHSRSEFGYLRDRHTHCTLCDRAAYDRRQVKRRAASKAKKSHAL